MYALQVLIEIVLYFAPYLLCAGAGAYLEGKFGQKANALLAKEVANLKLEIAALRVKL